MKSSDTFLNAFIRANSSIIKSIIKSFIIAHTMTENEHKTFTNILSEIMVVDHGICNHDLRKEMKMVV